MNDVVKLLAKSGLDSRRQANGTWRHAEHCETRRPTRLSLPFLYPTTHTPGQAERWTRSTLVGRGIADDIAETAGQVAADLVTRSCAETSGRILLSLILAVGQVEVTVHDQGTAGRDTPQPAETGGIAVRHETRCGNGTSTSATISRTGAAR
jgi:hypothetical protein